MQTNLSRNVTQIGHTYRADCANGQTECTHLDSNGACLAGGPGACLAGSKCTVVSQTMEEMLSTGTEPRFFDEVVERDGSSALRAKPSSWFGDEKEGTRPMSVHVWQWKSGEIWQDFDELNNGALEQAWADDRATAVVHFEGFAHGSVLVNMGDLTMGDPTTPYRQKVRRTTTTGQRRVPKTLNGRVQVLPQSFSGFISSHAYMGVCTYAHMLSLRI